MQSRYFRVCFARFCQILAITFTISTASCSFNLEKPTLPNKVSCDSNKCCYKINEAGDTQVCGTGSTNELQFQIKHLN